MLTARGWWLLVPSVVLAVIGTIGPNGGGHPTVAILGYTLLAWLIGEWTLFAVRTRFALPTLRLDRVVTQNDRTVSTGWAGLALKITTRITNPSRYRVPLAALTECGSDASLASAMAPLAAGETADLQSELHPKEPGAIHLAGVQVRMQDLNGFFRAERFVSAPLTVSILPPLTDEQGRQRSDKRFNSLLPPGTHRFRMPGSGSELLDLRDYRPGDPPKMIAWKPSARRDRLITKEFENEVPVRCLLFIDTSNVVRIGDSPPLTRLVSTAAGIVLAASANRDLVGVTFFDADSARAIAPARSPAHVTRLLAEFADTAALLPEIPETDADALTARLEPLLKARHPKLFDSALNTRPWGLYWRPLLDRRFGWLIVLPFPFAAWLATQSFWLDIAASAARSINPNTRSVFFNFAVFLITFLLVLGLPSVLASLFWLCHGLIGFLPGPRRRTRRRKQIGAAFAVLDTDSPAAIERYQFDDDALARRAGRFFREERLRVPVRRYDADGCDRFREPAKITVAAKALIRATTRARDNELYVFLVDLLDVSEDLVPLQRAIKLARSRHHHILVITVWPGDVSTERPEQLATNSLSESVRQARIENLWRSYDRLRRGLSRSGAIVLRLTARDTVRTVLDYLDRLRGTRSHR